MDTVRRFAWDLVMGALGHPLTPYVVITLVLLRSIR